MASVKALLEFVANERIGSQTKILHVEKSDKSGMRNRNNMGMF